MRRVGGPDQSISLPVIGIKQLVMGTIANASYSIGWRVGIGTMRQLALSLNLNATPMIGTMISVRRQISSTSGTRGSCTWVNCISLCTARLRKLQWRHRRQGGSRDSNEPRFAVLPITSRLLPLHINANVYFGSESGATDHGQFLSLIKVLYDRWAQAAGCRGDYCCRFTRVDQVRFSISTLCFAMLLLQLAYT